MENAVDAMKIGFALLVFAIAITLTFSVVGQAKATADVIFVSTDKTSFYDYATNEDYNAKEDRMVGFETILPTIHRYAKEQYAVTIFSEDGEPIVRYDLYTEGFMASWNETIKNMQNGNITIQESALKTYQEVETRLSQVQSVVNKDLEQAGKTSKVDDIMKYIGTQSTIASNSTKLLYHGKTDISNINIVAPWIRRTRYRYAWKN